jgi:MFS family permease
MDPIDREFSGAAANKPTAWNDTLLFWACFMAIVATAFGFVVRTQIIEDWGKQFSLSKTQQGEIFGVGLWPFAISIVLFSLIIDKIGYGKSMVFAFVCHVGSAILTIMAPFIAGDDPVWGYWTLYVATFIVALGNGTVEAVTNPVVATLFANDKTKFLNRLHGGWPGGLVLGGILALAMGDTRWEYKVALLFLPVVAYAVMMFGRKFPVNERVAAGVSYMSMLQQVGFLGALIVMYLIVSEVGRIAGLKQEVQWVIMGVGALAYGLAVRSFGQPLFVFLLLIMVPLATTELGTDSWIGDLMGPAMKEMGLAGGWVLIYTSAIMLVLRFFAGPIVHKLSPIGLLAVSALVAAIGLVFLSKAEGLMILGAATLYGLGKSFFWPTMLGVVAEQFPKGGALTLNTCGGVGMLAVGVVGASFLGYNQDSRIDQQLEAKDPALYASVVGSEKVSVFGTYKALDEKKVDELPAEKKAMIKEIEGGAKKNALMTVAILPVIMFVCYLLLIFYFKAKGGYKPQIIISDKEEGMLMSGGSAGPADF